jgi:hypothetical protein
MIAPLIPSVSNSDISILALPDNNDGTGSKRDEELDIYFCGSGFNTDLELGPVPLMTISREFLRDGAGSYLGVNNKINLTGKIYNSGVPGLSHIIDREKTLRDLIKTGVGDLEVKNTATGGNIFTGSVGNSDFGKNARITNYSIDKTSDYWVYSADYSIDLVYYEPIAPTLGSKYRVSSINESWSLEPIGELVYLALTKAVSKRTETEPTAATTMSSVMVTGLPQFRLTRKLSAVGVRDVNAASHDRSSKNEYNFQGITQESKNDAYLQAKKWIEDRLNLPFENTNNQKGDYTSKISTAYNVSSFTNLFVCNHTRSINYSITEGSYEVNDTWLALPSGVRHTEEFTIESSTDDKYVKTVKVQGLIKGLQVTSSTVVTSNTNIPDSTGKINLNQYNIAGEGGSIGNPSKVLSGEKYTNALKAWIEDIKPSLYTRACLALRSPDRTQDYYPSNYNGGTLPPGNPAFRKENLLNIIPISTSESHDTLKGALGYTFEYNNALKVFSGVIAESVSINVTGPGDQAVELFVLGRPLGPVLQSLGTKTATTKSVNIELVIPPPTTSAAFNMANSTCPVWTGGYIFQTCEAIIEGQKPFGKRFGTGATLPNSQTKGPYQTALGPFTGDVYVKSDTYSWSPSEGRYTRNIEWIFEPASTGAFSYLTLGG